MPKNEEPEVEVQASGARPGGENKKSDTPTIEKLRVSYRVERDAFNAALTSEGEINHESVIECTSTLIHTRLELYRLLIANIENLTEDAKSANQFKAAYLAILLIDLQDILQGALPSFNALHQRGMQAFLKEIFRAINIDYQLNDTHFADNLVQVLKYLEYIDQAAIENLFTIFSDFNNLDALIDELNKHFQTFQKNPIDSNRFFVAFIMCMELMSQQDLLILLRKRDCNGYTSIHLVCWDGQTDIFKALLDTAVFTLDHLLKLLQMTSNHGHTPIHLACWDGRTDIFKALIDAVKSNVFTLDQLLGLLKMTTNQGSTPLHEACRGSQTDIFSFLLDYCKKDPAFAAMLKKLLDEIQKTKKLTVPNRNSKEDKVTKEALAALLAWLEAFKPDDACNTLSSSTLDDDDDDDDNGNPPQNGNLAGENATGTNNSQSITTITLATGNGAEQPQHNAGNQDGLDYANLLRLVTTSSSSML